MSEQKKYSINFFDVVILLLIVAVGLGGMWILNRGKATTAVVETKPIHYTVVLDSIEDDMSPYIKEGDELREAVKNYRIGKVEQVRVAECTDMIPDGASGRYVEKPVPERSKIYIDVVADAVESDSALTIDSAYVVRAGVAIFVKGPCYAGEGMIVSVEREAK